MEDFADVAKARASWKLFSEAMNKGREILLRAGVESPPPIPDFDAVFRKLDARARENLYADLRAADELSPADALRIWKPLIRKAFAVSPVAPR